MFWGEPKDLSSDCYFCLTNIKGFTSISKHTVELAELPCAVRPVPHGEKLPVPKPQKNLTFVLILMLIYLLTAIGLSPGGSSTVHIYTQTIHRTTQNKQYTEQHYNYGRVRAVPRLG